MRVTVIATGFTTEESGAKSTAKATAAQSHNTADASDGDLDFIMNMLGGKK
jgi:hypothetical protein